MKGQPFTYVTWNISGCDKNWKERAAAVTQVITELQPDILGLVEAHSRNLEELMSVFSSLGLVYVLSQPIDPSNDPGRCDMIAYNLKRFLLKEHKSIYLSRTPDRFSKDWDSFAPRVATTLKLLDRSCDVDVVASLGHLDNKVRKARNNQARVWVDFLDEFYPNEPTAAGGDFNASFYHIGPEAPDTTATHRIFADAGFIDPQQITYPTKRPPYTYNMWDLNYSGTDFGMVNPDHIYYRWGSDHGIVPFAKPEVIQQTPYGVIPSDHWPILQRFQLT
ncbi:MAG TPA: endonuclease/exonuclease/phosphatase family protein [Candidatus Nitrosocosmicus sp.]|nr:endonuclease/exonuclease/phosphatase family protein [Candidatus Nitrosocosmicus sp.]